MLKLFFFMYFITFSGCMLAHDTYSKSKKEPQKTTISSNYNSLNTVENKKNKKDESKIELKTYLNNLFKQNKDYVEKAALFSYSQGYTDDGHICVFITQDYQGIVLYFKPNTHTITTKKKLSQKQVLYFKKVLDKSLNLADYSRPSFGGIRYEFIYEQKEKDSKIKVLKTLNMLNPSLGKEETKEHQNLIQSFKDLLKEQT